MPTAYSYMRFSTLAQAGGDSLRRQAALLDGWLGRNPKVPLDTTLKLTDKGISAISGEHRNNPDRHALARFLEAVRVGRVKRGDYLIVENLDRLTREHVQAALLLCLNLLQAGVRIVQLTPQEFVFDDKTDTWDLMRMILELSRGAAESAAKVVRLSEVWGEKKRRASEAPLTNRVPGWVQLVDEVRDTKGRLVGGRLVLQSERAAIVQRMIRLSREGMGCCAIAAALNSDGLHTFDRAKEWRQPSVYGILTSRALVGEYQPHKGRRAKRQAHGDPVPNYYPALLTEDEFGALQRSLTRRKKTGAGRQSSHVNLFHGLMIDARDGGAIHAGRAKARPSTYFTANARHGIEGAVWSCFPLEGFDRAILSALAEVRIEDTPRDSALDGLNVRLGVVEKKLVKYRAAMLGEEEESEDVLEIVRQLTRERHDLREKIRVEGDRLASQPALNLSNLQAMLGSDADRQKLAWAIREVVEEMRCLFVGGRGSDRVALVRLKFRDLPLVRHYWIDYIPARAGNQRKPTPELFTVVEVKLGVGVMPPDADLSTPEGVKNLDALIRYTLRAR